ncbi:MAG: hypothetical protein GEU78_07990 [Actinobacteria bacterium]|nr:hypothetical protein [Actinomycetota bacterium]
MNAFDRQRQLEITSVERGVKRYMNAINADRSSGREFDGSVGQSVMAKMLETLVPEVRRLQREARKKLAAAHTTGQRLMGWEVPVEASDAWRLAYITARTVVNMPSRVRQRIAAAQCVGRLVNLEFRWGELRVEEKLRAKDTPPNRIEMMKRRVRRINPRSVRKWLRLMDDITTTEWDAETRLKVGLALLDLVVVHCSDFVELVHYNTNLRGRVQTMTSIVLRAEVTQAMDEEYARRSECTPWFLPMLCPPRPWVWDGQKFVGGYLTHDTPLIAVTQCRHTAAVVTEDSMPPVCLAAMRAINETSWAINTSVMAVAEEATHRRAAEVLPVAPPRDMPAEIPADEWAKMTTAERGAVKNARRLVHDHNNRLQAKRDAMHRALQVAFEFVDEPTIYFPHSLDFRGRAYPVPQDLHPQADDFARGLLVFSRSRPLGQAGVRWLCYHAAKTYGMDKLPRDDQVDWCVEHLADLYAVAFDPLGSGYAFWSQAEEPWQFLAVAKELDAAFRYAKGPEWFPSRLPVYVDGSCNGLQHLSAMGLDPIGAKATNLTSSPIRQDIYQIVADKVKEQVQLDADTARDQGIAAVARNWLGQVDRKVVKRGVMTVPYGLTDIGMRDQIIHDRWTDGLPGDPMKNATYLRDLMKAAIEGTVIKATEIMDWMQDSATILARAGKPVDWTTPSGFRVRQAYYERSHKTIRTLIGETTLWQDDVAETLRLRKQALSIAPNMIHSFDAAHMVLTIAAASQAGFNNFAVIHDSFGCHASQMDDFLMIVREEFVNIYQTNWFESLQHEFQSVAGPDVPLISPPERGDFDVSQVRGSDFFFA